MRHLLLALMIALLPLRGWVGDAMAMEMAARTVASLPDASSAAQAHPHAACQGDDPVAASAASPAPAHAMAHTGQSAGAPITYSDCGSCTTCEVCHSAAVVTGFPDMPALPLPVAVPAARPAVFASAVPAPGFKPPIF